MKKIYFDHNATTPVHPEVKEAMQGALGEDFGNPSSAHWAGQEPARLLAHARSAVASLINAAPVETVFTSGGSEGDNMAIKGTLMKHGKSAHMITTTAEHHAVLNTCRLLERFGFGVTYVDVDSNGIADPDDIRKAIRGNTVLISVIYANNEVGSINDIRSIAQIAHEHGALCHTDAVQAVGKVNIDVKELGVDMLTASGHKFNAAKGVGFQYIRKGVEVLPLVSGGHQEFGLRAGTENIPGITGLGRAAELVAAELAERQKNIGALRDMLERGILDAVPDTVVNGHPEKRTFNTTNITFMGIDADALLTVLNSQGIAVSTGSACSTGDVEPSHVLTAMGLDGVAARGAVRFSLGLGNTEEEVRYCLEVLPPIVEKLRKISPLGG